MSVLSFCVIIIIFGLFVLLSFSKTMHTYKLKNFNIKKHKELYKNKNEISTFDTEILNKLSDKELYERFYNESSCIFFKNYISLLEIDWCKKCKNEEKDYEYCMRAKKYYEENILK